MLYAHTEMLGTKYYIVASVFLTSHQPQFLSREAPTALQKNSSVLYIITAGVWHLKTTFTSFYQRAVTQKSKDTFPWDLWCLPNWLCSHLRSGFGLNSISSNVSRSNVGLDYVRVE